MGRTGWWLGNYQADRAVPMGLGQQTQVSKRTEESLAGLLESPDGARRCWRCQGPSGAPGLDGLCLGRWRPSVFKKANKGWTLLAPSHLEQRHVTQMGPDTLWAPGDVCGLAG